jgi:hypothetical protein
VYAIDQNPASGQLYTYNPATKSTVMIGSGIGFKINGLTAFAPNGTFFTDRQDPDPNGWNDVLAQVNLSTGVATPIGTGMGVPIFAGVFVNGTLYGFGPGPGPLFNTPSIYTINTTTGAATFAGGITGLAPGDSVSAAGIQQATAIPEPSTLACALIGALSACAAGVRRAWLKGRARCPSPLGGEGSGVRDCGCV